MATGNKEQIFMNAASGRAAVFAVMLVTLCCGSGPGAPSPVAHAQTVGKDHLQSVEEDIARLKKDLGPAAREQLQDLANRMPRFFRLHEREIAMVVSFLPEQLRPKADIFVEILNNAVLSVKENIGHAREKINVYLPEHLLQEISKRGFPQAVASYYEKNCGEFGKPSLYWDLNEAILDEIENIESQYKSKRERTCRMIQVAVAAYPAIGMAILNGGS
jgi:hypothetical protein